MLEFGEFCQLAAKFLVEEDDEALKKELKEAFRIYDKDQLGYISTGEQIKLHILPLAKQCRAPWVGLIFLLDHKPQPQNYPALFSASNQPNSIRFD